MKRKLVCRNEIARHPIRQMMPPPVIDRKLSRAQTGWWQNEDLHLFMLSFTAFFVAITGLII